MDCRGANVMSVTREPGNRGIRGILPTEPGSRSDQINYSIAGEPSPVSPDDQCLLWLSLRNKERAMPVSIDAGIYSLLGDVVPEQAVVTEQIAEQEQETVSAVQAVTPS